MTIQLFRADPYRLDFTAMVVWRRGGYIVLDQTFFQPADPYGGAGDTGTIDGFDVVEVVSDGATRLLHHVRDEPGPGPVVGARVTGAIDWARRYREMRVHTATHLVNLAVRATHDVVGSRTVRSRLDLVLGSGELDLTAVKDWTRGVVAEDRAMFTSEQLGRGWLWHLDGQGHSECSQLHVSSTGEVGAVDLSVFKETGVRLELQIDVGGIE